MASDDNSRMTQQTFAAPTETSLAGATRLGDWGVIRVAGSDAASFLQNQLTNDVLQLDEAQARLAGYCSAKGRLLASFVIWRSAADEIMLACSSDLLAQVHKRLSMFVLRAKCKLSDASQDVALWGLAGDAVVPDIAPWRRAKAADGGTLIRLPDARLGVVRVPRALRAVPTAEPPPVLPVLTTDAWRWLEVHSGTARIVAATVEQFVPQMINFEIVGGVNFQKGCYPGQEVVARSQYRGTIKRRAYVGYGAAPLTPGQEVFASDDASQPVGMVVLAASMADRHAALVELKLGAAAAELHGGAVDGPRITLGALPYDILTEPA